MIPAPILPKIEQHWKNLIAHDPYSSNLSTTSDGDHATTGAINAIPRRVHSTMKLHSRSSIRNLSKPLENKSHEDEDEYYSDEPCPVIYAEERKGVCIIFTDIVGFSKISQKLSPLQVMEMLQSIFVRFDKLRDLYNVQKLETIGDTYMCYTGLFVEGQRNGKMEAHTCLTMAQEMVKASETLRTPTNPPERLQIRVGIHVGDLSCGVLGEVIPKFSVYGDAVNLAARMEQTSLPSKIHVSKEFHDLLDR